MYPVHNACLEYIANQRLRSQTLVISAGEAEHAKVSGFIY